MKKTFSFFVMMIFMSLFVQAQKFILNIKNSTSTDLECKTYYDHGVGFERPTIAKGATEKFEYYTAALSLFTGVQGQLQINPLGDKNAMTVIYYNNPYIGKSSYSFGSSTYASAILAYTNVTWLADMHLLNVEIINPKGQKAM